MAEPVDLWAPLTLPNGAVLSNRIAKAAMEEQLGTPEREPGQLMVELYRKWGEGGAGLIVTGNVMVDAAAMTSPGGVVVDRHTSIESLEQLAAAAHAGEAAIWLQINHPGRQVRADMLGRSIAPSAVPLELGDLSSLFAVPREMTDDDIEQVQRLFVDAAVRATSAGFDGVQVHAAHGYLLSQFLSPITNRRNDRWGGALPARSRMLLEIVARIRREIGPKLSVSVKLNTADFQRGGFDVDDAAWVIDALAGEGVDLVELSGGSFESPAMQGAASDRTLAREAYFLELSADLVKAAPLPIMLTGGIQRGQTAERVLASGVSVVGVATGMAVTPDLPNRWRDGRPPEPQLDAVAHPDPAMAGFSRQAVVRNRLFMTASGEATDRQVTTEAAVAADSSRRAEAISHYQSWLDSRKERLDATRT